MNLPPFITNRPSWARRLTAAALFVAFGMFFSFCIFIAWVKLYPEDNDPKNIDYVLWRHGLNGISTMAVAGMTHDTWAVNIVKGMSTEQLKSRFGYVRSYQEARPYLQLCYTPETVGELGVHPRGKEVVFLRESAWMAILDHGKTVDLVLCKGY